MSQAYRVTLQIVKLPCSNNLHCVTIRVHNTLNCNFMTHFIAVVYDPLRERKTDDFIGGWSPIRPMVYPFSVQIPEGGELLTATSTKGRQGQNQDIYHVQKFKSVFFRPSANLDIDATDWQHCLKDSMVQWRLGIGALEVIEPDEEALKREPNGIGYRMFCLDKALYLVQKAKDLVMLREWASLEERKPVLEAIAKQEEAIRSHLRKLQEN